MDFKLELVLIPVTDVDRARDFYLRAGFALDVDTQVNDQMRVVQVTPPGSACSVGFVAEIPGSESFDEAQVVDAIARADYAEPEATERPAAPPPAPALRREGGVFRRFLGGFRYDSEGD